MTRFLVSVVLFLFCLPAYAMPEFLELYRNDPFRNPNVDGCNTCHMSPEGGDARNAFGQAFERDGLQITPMLRAQFPDRFVYPISRVNDSLTIHFSDPDKKEVVVEAAGMKNLVDFETTAVNGVAATNTTEAARPSRPAEQRAQAPVPVDPYAREGAFFGSNVVNLPNGKPQKAGGVDLFVGHRFAQDVSDAGLAGLFGFDSTAVVAYGIRAGITDRLSVGVLRSNLFRTISLSSSFQISRQDAAMPLTLQLRGGVDGVRNFGLYHKKNNPLDRQYSPFIQIISTRTFKDRLSLTAIPTFAFNTRNEQLDAPGFAFGTEHNSTIALGIGAGVRILPTVSVVGEYIPRLWGFRGEIKDRPGVSIGLQKSTYRHTFELVFSRQQPMTPAQDAFQGVDTFRIGFNIYRKIR